MRKLRAWLSFAAIAVALPLTGALAQSDSETLADFRACATISIDSARLGCFDGVAAQPEAPEGDEKVPAADDASPARTIRIVEIRTVRPNEAVFITDSGQVWEQTSGGRESRFPPLPFDAVLEPGALGSTFLISPLGGARVRVTLRD